MTITVKQPGRVFRQSEPRKSTNGNMKELLYSITKKDFVVQTFRAGGSGGQNQNKVESGVRIIHPESGAVGEARDSRDQLHNKRNAFKRMVASKKFQDWIRVENARRAGHKIMSEKEIEKQVDELMHEKNLKIEFAERF